MKLPARFPARIMRQLRSISFKSKETLLRHCQTLIAAWRYSQPGKWRAAEHARQRNRQQQQGKDRRDAAHAQICRQAYNAEMRLVGSAKGHHTLAGIPV